MVGLDTDMRPARADAAADAPSSLRKASARNCEGESSRVASAVSTWRARRATMRPVSAGSGSVAGTII